MRTQQEVLAEHPTNRQHAAHLRNPQLVELATSRQRHRQHVGQLTNRKRNLQLVEALVVQGTNKKALSINLVYSVRRTTTKSKISVVLVLAKQLILRLSQVGGFFQRDISIKLFKIIRNWSVGS